jgi:iron complex outermembrane receptor protein
VSLRGLSTSSTLVLFDGLRAAYFPLADDGTRNFVDLNTIPDDIVDRVEVLRDGASSSYGADAIAGVVNIITKREFTGVSTGPPRRASPGGDAANQRLTLTIGHGDLDDNGFNAYVSGPILSEQRGTLQPRPRLSVQHGRSVRGICSDQRHRLRPEQYR